MVMFERVIDQIPGIVPYAIIAAPILTAFISLISDFLKRRES